MLSLLVLFIWELSFYLVELWEFYEAASGGLILVLGVVLLLAVVLSVDEGFISRIAVLISLLWYMGRVADWSYQIDLVLAESGSALGILMALMILVLVPVGMLAACIWTPAIGILRYRHWRRK